jgi:hypothetical protein
LVTRRELPELLNDFWQKEPRLRDEIIGSRRDELPGYLAEYIINSHTTLPDYNSIAWFWNIQARHFLALREHQDLRPLWNSVRQAQAEYGRAIESLLENLREIRSDISFRLDVPLVEKA